MKLQTLKDLYVHQLKALNSAEEQILEMLPKMIQAAATRNFDNFTQSFVKNIL